MSACPSCPTSPLYIEALRERILGRRLERSRVVSLFLLRSVESAHRRRCTAPRLPRSSGLGKRIAIGFDNDVWLVLHLMIAGRLQWRARVAGIVLARRLRWRSASTTGTLVADGSRN